MHFLQSGHISSLSTSSPQAGHSFMTMFSPLRLNFAVKRELEIYKFYLVIPLPYICIFQLSEHSLYKSRKVDNVKKPLTCRLHSRI